MYVVALTLSALALATSGAASSSSVASGLRGVVMRGPTTPVCFEEEPCEEPAAGITLRFTRSGAVVARVKTGPAGGYAVRLRPGIYTVTTLPFRVGMALTPRRVRVPAARLARIDFHLDTGIQ